jgi:hypothetical protein
MVGVKTSAKAQKETNAMTTKPTPTLTAVESAVPADPFDLDALRLSQDFVEEAGVKRLITEIPVRKPSRHDFFRVHPDPAYQANFLMVNLKEEQEFYLVTQNLAKVLAGETVRKTIYTAINRQGVTFLWPVTLPMPDGKDLAWWRSEREAAELAKVKWVRIKANMSLGANDILEAIGIVTIPEWPELSFQEMLRIAFRNLIIDRPDHPIIDRLNGRS